MDGLYDNQIDLGRRVINAFNDHIHSVLAFANTQCGKTGAILAAIHLSNIPFDHIFVITGLSSVDWVEQTKSRIPLKHIYHRNTIHKFIRKIKGLQNYLVFIDECHIAFKSGQTIRETISSFHHSAKTVYVSATPDWDFFKPDGIIRDGFSIRVMKDNPLYRSIIYFKDHHLILPCKSLIKSDALINIEEIRSHLSSTPKYHIIRTSRTSSHHITIINFKKVFGDDFFYISMPTNLSSILSISPLKHSFIFIKDTIRCAITIPKQFIGVLYDRFTLFPNKSSVIQGLAGRATGFHSFDIVIFSFLQFF